jgi:regulator of sigma E protease
MITAIVLGIGIFMFLVIIHEFGHFWTSRKFGVKVQEFGVGIPPKVTTLTVDKK